MNFDLTKILAKAERSKLHLWILNFALHKLIPFNAAHKLKIVEVHAESMKIRLPYRSANMNHLRGMHACALAALCEYTCGLTLTRSIDTKSYRFILRSLDMKYEKQAREDVFCSFSMDQKFIQEILLDPLKKNAEVFHVFNVEVKNKKSELICTSKVEWQFKSWDNVRNRI